MNEICLTQNHHIFQILYQYLQKKGMNFNNSSITKLFELFIQTYEITYKRKEIKIDQLNSKILQITEDLNTYNIDRQYSVIKNIKNQREQLHFDLDSKESHLHQIEKSINQIHNDSSITQKMYDLKEGIRICRERYLLIKEENEEFNQILISLTQQKQQLKNRYKFVQDQIKNNLKFYDDMKENSLNLNQRLIKQLKTVTELFQLNHKRQKYNNVFTNHIDIEDTSIYYIQIQFEFLINLQMQIQNKTESNLTSENDILDIIQTLLNLKQQQNQINYQDNSQQQQQEYKLQKQTIIPQRYRFKTHHNLGQIHKRKFSQYDEQDFKVVSEYDEIKENQSSDNEYLQQLIQISPKKPWHFKSVIIDSNKNSEKKMEYLSEQQIKSLASISSNASFQDLGIITLKEELQTVYSYDQTQEDNKDVINCDILDTQDINQINPQITNKIQNIYDYKNKRNYKIISFILITIGITGWVFKRSK